MRFKRIIIPIVLLMSLVPITNIHADLISVWAIMIGKKIGAVIESQINNICCNKKDECSEGCQLILLA